MVKGNKKLSVQSIYTVEYSQQERMILVHDRGFRFKFTERSGKLLWRCVHSNSAMIKCKAQFYTDLEAQQFIGDETEPSHSEDCVYELEEPLQKKINEMKMSGATDTMKGLTQCNLLANQLKDLEQFKAGIAEKLKVKSKPKKPLQMPKMNTEEALGFIDDRVPISREDYNLFQTLKKEKEK